LGFPQVCFHSAHQAQDGQRRPWYKGDARTGVWPGGQKPAAFAAFWTKRSFGERLGR
jgi:hypothetical protein